MKNIKATFTLCALLVGLFALSAPADAQTIIVPTTLSAAIADSQVQVMTVGSVSLVSGYTVVAGTVGFIDNEEVVVKPLNGTVSGTTLAIIRGQGGTTAAPHASGALVFLGPPQAFSTAPSVLPQGKCTRGNQLYLPYINARVGVISDCVGGQWVQGVRTASPRFRVYAPEPGGTAYTSLNTNGTAVGATTVYCTEVNLPTSKLLTGIGVLNGTTVTGNARYAILYDSAGNAIANSALAGVASVTASIYEQFAFTAKYFATGPAQYFACIQDNAVGGTTVRMAVTGVNDNILTKGQTGATFGTIPALTVPTTFTTAVGPYVYLY